MNGCSQQYRLHIKYQRARGKVRTSYMKGRNMKQTWDSLVIYKRVICAGGKKLCPQKVYKWSLTTHSASNENHLILSTNT